MMENNMERKYLLVIKRDKNDYLPLEWFRTEFYNGENLNSLEGIDTFTSRVTHVDLLENALELGVIDLDDKYLDFSVIFYDNGKWREVREGCIFSDSMTLDDPGFIDIIVSCAENKEIINNITNLFNKGFNSEASKQLYMILKNISSFYEVGEDYFRRVLEVFYKMPYEERRKLRISVSKMFMNRINKNNDKMIYRKNNDIIAA